MGQEAAFQWGKELCSQGWLPFDELAYTEDMVLQLAGRLSTKAG